MGRGHYHLLPGQGGLGTRVVVQGGAAVGNPVSLHTSGFLSVLHLTLDLLPDLMTNGGAQGFSLCSGHVRDPNLLAVPGPLCAVQAGGPKEQSLEPQGTETVGSLAGGLPRGGKGRELCSLAEGWATVSQKSCGCCH